jgi:radical SAM superfamily enzyme YgiQ (UPF0313 family)
MAGFVDDPAERVRPAERITTIMSWNIVSEHRRKTSREKGTVIKDWGGRIPVALIFPNTYHAGMSNLGFQAVYGLMNGYPDVVCERFFLPDSRWATEYQRTGTPLLSSETQRPLREFELAAFSFSHENDYPGLLTILRLSGLAWRRVRRGEQDPLILAGGVTMRTNPEPLAEFLDLVLMGDGEIGVPSLLQAWREARSTPLPKAERVLHLSRSVSGAYAPGLYEAALAHEGRLTRLAPTHPDLPETITVARLATLPTPALTTHVLTDDTEFANTRLVEIGRGCPRACRFCLAGFVYRPPRFQSIDSILKALGPPTGETERIGLISPAVNDHPEIEDLLRGLVDQGRDVTVSSMRVECLTPELIKILALGRLKSVAVAPEAGSERLRSFINKNLSEKQIIEGVDLLARNGIKRLKLYFMIGLPSETMDDVAAIAGLVQSIKRRLSRSSARVRLQPEITLSVSSFVPKPFTPFERIPMATVRDLKHRADLIRKSLRKERGIRILFDPPRWAYLQTLLSRGDRRTAEVIEALAGSDHNLTTALKNLSFDPDTWVVSSLDEPSRLPWSFIDHGFAPGYLKEELQHSFLHRQSPPCQPNRCRRCGICADPSGI